MHAQGSAHRRRSLAQGSTTLHLRRVHSAGVQRHRSPLHRALGIPRFLPFFSSTSCVSFASVAICVLPRPLLTLGAMSPPHGDDGTNRCLLLDSLSFCSSVREAHWCYTPPEFCSACQALMERSILTRGPLSIPSSERSSSCSIHSVSRLRTSWSASTDSNFSRP